MIDQQEGTEGGASGDDLGAPFSLSALLRAHFLTTRKRAVVLPVAAVRSPRGGPPGRSFPAQ